MGTVAQALARGLRQGNVGRLFGLPGGEVVHVLEAIRQAGLPFVLTRHETVAAFMAGTTARLTRSPGACLTTLGPGAANATAGLAHAHLDRSPLLLITGQMSDHLRPGHTHQYLDLQALFGAISKASWQLAPAGAEGTVARALYLAQAARPGPVHLQLTSEEAVSEAVEATSAGGRQLALGVILGESTGERKLEPAAGGGLWERGLESAAIESTRERGLEAATAALRDARRPVLVCGLGLEPEGPYAELQAVAEALGTPVITTPKAKGALPASHPLAAGAIGLTSTDPAYGVLDEADCVLAVGFDPVELVRPWGQRAPLIWIAGWANTDPALPAAAEIVGELAPALRRLAQVRPGTERGWGGARVARYRAETAIGPRRAPARGRITPQQALAALREVLPDETIVSVDVGSHKILACLEWPMPAPNRFLVSNGLSSMGYGLPAAIAARHARPDDPALCLTGDAGLAMVFGELGTLAEVGGPAVVVVFKDDALDLIRSHQRRAGLPPFGTEFRGPDFVRIAEAHGIEGVRAPGHGALAEATERALRQREPILIEVAIDPASYPTTPA